jgi:hypothetical protein
LTNKVSLSCEHDASKPGRVVVRDPAPTGDPVLDAAVQIILARQGSKPATLIRTLGKNLRQIRPVPERRLGTRVAVAPRSECPCA